MVAKEETAARSSRAAKLLSPTTTSWRYGIQRRICKII